MSELSLGTLSGLAANSYVIDVAAGSTLDLSNATDLPATALPAGSILQVVSTTKTDTFSSALTLGYVAVTGLTASITPSSTSSKVLVSGYCSVATSLTENSSDIAIYKDGVALTGASGDANGSAKRATSGGVAYTTSQRGIASVPFSFLDSPSTTSTVSYEIYVGFTNNSATTMYVNRAASDGANDYNSRWASTITLTEVAG
jgi:hypothetical protein